MHNTTRFKSFKLIIFERLEYSSILIIKLNALKFRASYLPEAICKLYFYFLRNEHFNIMHKCSWKISHFTRKSYHDERPETSRGRSRTQSCIRLYARPIFLSPWSRSGSGCLEGPWWGPSSEARDPLHTEFGSHRAITWAPGSTRAPNAFLPPLCSFLSTLLPKPNHFNLESTFLFLPFRRGGHRRVLISLGR